MARKTHYTPFSTLTSLSVSESFRPALAARIRVLEKRSRIMNIFSSIGLSVVSLIALVVSCMYVSSAAVASGFGQYVSLVFTDGTALAFSKELGLSLLESLPALSVALALTTALVFIWAISRLVQQSRERRGLTFA